MRHTGAARAVSGQPRSSVAQHFSPLSTAQAAYAASRTRHRRITCATFSTPTMSSQSPARPPAAADGHSRYACSGVGFFRADVACTVRKTLHVVSLHAVIKMNHFQISNGPVLNGVSVLFIIIIYLFIIFYLFIIYYY